MKIIQVQFAPWDKVYDFDPAKHNLKIKDHVIVKTELGTDMGQVVGIKEVENYKEIKNLKPIIRKANLSDIEKVESREKNKNKTLKICRELIKKHNLPAKLVDVKFSFDGGKITFIFIARERIDFRELVKDLTRTFQKSVRMHQIGVREEAKIMGGVGPCGKELCCLRFLKNLGSISTDFILDQNLTHRGPERLSGPCGRLFCCLAYEERAYKELAAKLPALGSTIKTKRGEGKVIGHNVLKQTVKVHTNKDSIIEVPIE